MLEYHGIEFGVLNFWRGLVSEGKVGWTDGAGGQEHGHVAAPAPGSMNNR